MSRLAGLIRVVPFVLGTAAVAGVVHIGTIFAYPGRASDDAFSRIAALGPADAKIILPSASGGRLPSRDPAMLSAACRYDLANGPFRIAVGRLDDGFLSIGMHARHGTPYYGLNLRAAEGGALDLVLMTEGQNADADSDAPPHQLEVVAPESQGFVVFDTPVDGPDGGRAVLDKVVCGATAPSPDGPSG